MYQHMYQHINVCPNIMLVTYCTHELSWMIILRRTCWFIIIIIIIIVIIIIVIIIIITIIIKHIIIMIIMLIIILRGSCWWSEEWLNKWGNKTCLRSLSFNACRHHPSLALYLKIRKYRENGNIFTLYIVIIHNVEIKNKWRHMLNTKLVQWDIQTHMTLHCLLKWLQIKRMTTFSTFWRLNWKWV